MADGRDDKELYDEIGRKEERRRKARRRRGGHSFWLGLSMFGLVGWSVAIPTLLLTALGIWLDTRYGNGISWTLTGLFTGVVIGSLNVWFWINREGYEDEDEQVQDGSS